MNDFAKGLNVIFIDDDNVLLNIYKLWFKNYFKNIFVIDNRGMLDNILINYDIDMIFCDLFLKHRFLDLNENGYDVIDYIIKKYGRKTCWIISGYIDKYPVKPDVRRAIQGYIKKPFERKDITKIFGG